MTGADTDVAIIGGGPAGAAMGAYLAQAGVDCTVFEAELFPRPHVGESLVPSSTRVFRELDFLETMETSGFPRKYGAVWTADGSTRAFSTGWEGLAAAEHADVAFAEREQEGVGLDYTWHVDRGRFDLLLLQHASAKGARVHEGVRVSKVDFSDPEVVRLSCRLGGRDVPVRARMVVDASGRRTLIGTQQKWKVNDPVFDQYAIHTWFNDYDRSLVAPSPDKVDHIYIHFLPLTNIWVWQIPITDTITSIGCVSQKKHFRAAGSDRDGFFWKAVNSRPEFAAALHGASQLHPLKTEGDYSYAMRQIIDDRVVLIGDAARFVDPIFSTGVSIALNSARFASRDIIRAVEKADFRGESFHAYARTIQRGTRNWYEFISLYYRLNVLFTAFIRDPRYRLDVLKLLQGDVYDEEEPQVLAEMREIVSIVENDPNHVWHDLLGDLTANAFRPAEV